MTQTTSKPAEYLLCIGGEWQSAQTRKTFETRNPYTGEQIARVAAASAADARRAAWAANTEVVETPASGTPSPRARPRADANPTRTPVKLPGPMVTATKDNSWRATAAARRAVWS